jgi:hypothetical protein
MRGTRTPSTVVHKLKTVRDRDINSIWSEALRRVTPPPRVPWWKRIWLMPSPDGKPGGPWR